MVMDVTITGNGHKIRGENKEFIAQVVVDDKSVGDHMAVGRRSLNMRVSRGYGGLAFVAMRNANAPYNLSSELNQSEQLAMRVRNHYI